MINHRAIIIGGLTSSGKTALAQKLLTPDRALVNADSRQIYLGMEVGTGKDIPVEARRGNSLIKWRGRRLPVYKHMGIEWWGFDLALPSETFSAGDFYMVMKKILRHLWKRQLEPIIVTGTGFYMRTLLTQIPSLGVPRNQQLRRKLDSMSTEALQEKLKLLDESRFRRMNMSDKKNNRRLIRAIEIASFKGRKKDFKPLVTEALLIGLQRPFKEIEQRIKARIHKRANQSLTEEIRELVKTYDFFNQPVASTAIGYREWAAFMEGRLNRKQAIERWYIRERQYARQQLTWFKKQAEIHWINTNEPSWRNSVAALINSWYGRKV